MKAKILFVVLLVALIATACAAPTAAPTAAPPTKAPAAAPTTAPAAPTAAPAAATKAPEPTKAPAPTTAPAATSKGTIKIASQSPLSGDQASLGEGIKLGTQLAVEQLSKPLVDLGYKVEYVPFDDQAKPDVGVANAKNLVTDPDIMVVIGHLNSGVAIPSSEVYKDTDLAMVSPANTNPNVTDRGYATVNRVCGRDDVQGPSGAEFAAKELKVKSVYILHDKTTYGQGVAEFFRDTAKTLGLNILGFEGTEEKANFDPILTPIKAANPDLIYFGGLYPQAGPLIKQARAKGINSILLGPDGLDSSDFAKLAGDAAVNTYYTSVAAPAAAFPDAAQFIKDFKAKFNKDPQPFAAHAYDSAAIALKAIAAVAKDAKPTRKAVSAAIRATKDFKGITGVYTFNKNGDPTIAKYFFIKVTSGDPAKWDANPIAKTLEIAPPEKK
ncbi:MAG: branched-chain amino acid ABC transporter substrate-binding protein [Chloroflexi bacterium]|nr:branched-chain amino acid ABC transporter substrate-binding protein [Chloroflexota bacterium]